MRADISSNAKLNLTQIVWLEGLRHDLMAFDDRIAEPH